MKYIILAFLLAISVFTDARRYEAVSFSHEGLQVSARLSLPDAPPPYRAIVLVPGSGPNDKDCTFPVVGPNTDCLFPGLMGDTLRPYKGLSDALADAGYAVLTYDKLEYSYPTTLGTITFKKLWLPAMSGIGYLRSRSDIRGNDLVLLGHSEGSTLIPYMAKGDAGISAMISLAGPRRSAYDTLLSYQILEITKTCGGDTAAAKSQGAQLMYYFSLIRSGKWNSSTPPFAGVSASVWADYIKVADSVVINYNAFEKPRLFIGLGKDMNVPIATELTAFRNEVKGRADFYEIPDLLHYLCTPTDPAVSKVLTDTIVSWLRRELPPLGVGAVAGNTASAFRLQRDGREWRLSSKTEALRHIMVYDSNGRQVYQAEASGNSWKFHLPELAAGIYSLEVQGSKSRGVLRMSL
jgi:hypothetical protein